jgi:autotransporter translocation and assembly factor TamB
MGKILKWMAIGVCAILVLFAAGLIGGHVYLMTDAGSRRLLSLINTLYPGKITARQIEISLITQEASLSDATLKGPDGKTIIRTGNAYLKMDLLKLLNKDVVLETIRLSKPQGILTIDHDGWMNIETAFTEKNSTEVSPFNLYINDLAFEEGSLVFILPDGGELVSTKDLQFKMYGAFTNDTLIRLAIPSSRLTLTVAGRSLDLGSTSLSAAIFNDSIKDIRISSNKASSRLALTGSVKDMSRKAQLRFSLDLDADLADFRNDLGMRDAAEGKISGRIEAAGDYDNPSLSCSLAYGGGRLAGFKLGSTRLAGTMTDRVFSCRELTTNIASGNMRVTGSVDLRKVFPDGYFEGMKDADTLAYALSINGSSLNLPELPGLPAGLKGKLASRVNLEGKGIRPETLSLKGSFTARAEGLVVPGNTRIPDLSMEGRAEYAQDLLQLDPLVTKSDGAQLTARGKVNLASKVIDGTLNLDASDISRLLGRYGAAAKGSLSGQASVSGTLEQPVAEVSLKGEHCCYEDIAIGDIGMKGRLDQTGTFSVSECTVRNNTSAITASGSVGLFGDFPHLNPLLPVILEAHISSLSPHDFAPFVPVQGAFTGRIEARGSTSSISGDMSIDGKDVSISDIRIGAVTLQAMLKDGLFTVSSLDVGNGHSSFKAAGTAQVFKDHSAFVSDPGIDFRIQEGSLFLEDFLKDAKGLVSVTGDIRGTVRHPTGSAVMTGSNLSLGIQKFTGMNVEARLDGEKIWFEPVTLEVSPDRRIDGKGWVSMKGEYSLSASSTGIPLETLDLFREHNGFRGTAVVDISGEGTLEHPNISGKVFINNIFLKDQPFKDCLFSFHLLDRNITFEGSLNFNVQGSYDIGSGKYQVYTKFEETDLGPYFIIAGKPLLNGTLTGTLSAAGDIADFKTSIVEADFSKVDISLKGKNLVLAKHLAGSYYQGALSIPRTHITLGENGWFDLAGSGRLKDSLVLDAEGTLPVEVIASFMEELADGTGFIHFSTHIKPKDAHLDITSLITLDQLGYTIPYNGQRVHDTNGKIRWANNEISIDGITGQLDSGTFEAGGSALLEGFTPRKMELYLQARALPVVIPDTMDLTLDSEASFDAADGKSLLRSEVFILDGTYYKDVKVNLFTGVIERIIPPRRMERQQGVSMPWPFLENMALDITIQRRGDIKVENNIAELDLNPDLKIGGTLQEPIVTGRIAVTDGTVTFQRNEFTVSRGVIDFINPYKTEASVDIKGETKVRTWTIDLAVEGELDNLKFELSSTPAEEPADILSLLVVGKTSRELSQNQTGLTVSPSSMLAELMTNTYGEQVRKATSLDILKLESSEFATTGKGGDNLKLTLGKEFSQRMTIKYEMETQNTETIQRGIAEYKILENLLINGYQGSNGIFGADVQFKYEFR